MTEPQRYPLAWPAHRPRRSWKERVNGEFKETVEDGGRRRERKVTVATACERLEQQVSWLGGIYPLLSTNLELKMDGRPRMDRGPPADPGVCLYFQMKGEPYAMACDTFTEVAQNIAAIANHIEATRRITRYGVATAAETLQAFSALPPPSPTVIALGSGARPWREVMGFGTDFPGPGLSKNDMRDLIGARYRDRAKKCNEAELKDLNRARDAALAELEL